MCALDKMISCELSFSPLASADYLADVDRVLEVIAASGMAFETGDFATVVKGAKTEVFRLIQAVYDEMENACSFILGVRLSNACGCELK